MTDLTFYTNPMSRGRIVRWMLEEVGAPYQTEVLDYGTTMKAPAYLAINPMGKVPAIVHNETVVTEGAAICTYLADAFPDAGLAPAISDPDRGSYLRWMFFGAGPVEAAVTNTAMNWIPAPEKERATGYGNLEQVCDVLHGQLADGRTYLLGERFSALDVFLGSQIGWGLMFKTMPERPGFHAYFERIKDRPAAIRAREKDDALVEKHAPK